MLLPMLTRRRRPTGPRMLLQPPEPESSTARVSHSLSEGLYTGRCSQVHPRCESHCWQTSWLRILQREYAGRRRYNFLHSPHHKHILTASEHTACWSYHLVIILSSPSWFTTDVDLQSFVVHFKKTDNGSHFCQHFRNNSDIIWFSRKLRFTAGLVGRLVKATDVWNPFGNGGNGDQRPFYQSLRCQGTSETVITHSLVAGRVCSWRSCGGRLSGSGPWVSTFGLEAWAQMSRG